MGRLRQAWEWFTAPAFGASETFDASTETPPRPVDLAIYEMLHATGRVTRDEALSVPAVLRGRNLICSIATLPLVQHGPDRSIVRLPLLEQIDPDVANSVTLAQTVEDLLFEGKSWWRITRVWRDGYPVSAKHIAVASVSLQPPSGKSPSPLPSGDDPRGAVLCIDGQPVPWTEVICFQSPNPGLLKAGSRAIRRALLLDKAAATYANDPQPTAFFTPTEGADPADDDAVRDMLDDWRDANKRRSTAYVPASLKYNKVDVMSPADLQLVELQKRASLDIANALGLDPEDLGISTTSRTYQNATDRRQDRINDVLSPFMAAITDALSMPNVTKDGYRVRFDLDDYLRADPKTRWDVYKTGRELGAITVDEIRAEERLPALSPADQQAALPAPTAPARQQIQAWLEPSATFDEDANRPATFTADASVECFSVNPETRTITGLALPYNRIAVKNGRKFRFAAGSLRWTDPSRVKLLRDHDYSQAVGRAIELTDTPDGMQITFKVARGVEGDRVLALAEDGVLDGLSVGVDFVDVAPDPDNQGVHIVRLADLREVSLTAMPAFDDARVSSLAASRDQGETVPDNDTETAPATVPGPDLSAQFAAFLATQGQQPAPERPAIVNPTRTASTFVSEAAPYRFDRRTGGVLGGSHEFSADVFAAIRGDQAAHQRVVEFAQEHVEFVVTTDVDELNPTRQRPDMYVDQRSYQYPMWEAIKKGTLTDITPFTFPKFSSAGTLVAAHVEGTEPSLGTFVTTSQTVTPAAMSGKVKITRETLDQGGNPQVSNLIWRQMQKAWYEALEAKAAAVLVSNAASITDVTLTTAGGTTGQTAASETEAAFTALQFIRGGFTMDTMFAQIDYFKVLAAAKDGQGRPLYPRLNPTNANGQAQARFRALDVAGVLMYPAWALAASGTVAASSFLFDREVVHGWASAPQRIDIDRTEVANVYIGLWGYSATAISDFTGVREFIYDPV